MASVPLSKPVLAALKKALRNEFPDVRSSHLTEALAAALSRKSNAALLTDMQQQHDDPVIELLDDQRFGARLQEFGYQVDTEFSFEFISVPGLISTVPMSALDIEYRSSRVRAWRNLMVCTINEGVRRKLFSLRPGDNRWPEATPSGTRRNPEGHLFDFTLPTGLPARGYVSDIGFDELSFHVAVNPKGTMVRAINGDLYAGDAFASGFLERKTGAWIQSSSDRLRCRRWLLQPLAELDVHPLGFGDRGAL